MSGSEVMAVGEHALALPEGTESAQIVLMDRLDFEQALAELQGSVVSKFVYTVPGGKDRKTGKQLPDKTQLSYAGVKEAARLYRNVHFGATATPLPNGGWMIISYAHNLADNTRVDYPMPYPAFNPANAGEAINFRASLSKSLRNALAAVLPISYLETMITRWLGQQAGAQGTAGSALNSTTSYEHDQLAAEVKALLLRHPDARSKLETAITEGKSKPVAQKTVAELQALKSRLEAMDPPPPTDPPAIEGEVVDDDEAPADMAPGEDTAFLADAERRPKLSRYVDGVQVIFDAMKVTKGTLKPEQVAALGKVYEEGQLLMTSTVGTKASEVKPTELANLIGKLRDLAVDELRAGETPASDEESAVPF